MGHLPLVTPDDLDDLDEKEKAPPSGKLLYQSPVQAPPPPPAPPTADQPRLQEEGLEDQPNLSPYEGKDRGTDRHTLCPRYTHTHCPHRTHAHTLFVPATHTHIHTLSPLHTRTHTLCPCYAHTLSLLPTHFVPATHTLCPCYTHTLSLLHTLFVPATHTLCPRYTLKDVSPAEPSGQKRLLDGNQNPSAKKAKRSQKSTDAGGKTERNGTGRPPSSSL